MGCHDCFNGKKLHMHCVGRLLLRPGQTHSFNCGMCFNYTTVVGPEKVCKCKNCSWKICRPCLKAKAINKTNDQTEGAMTVPQPNDHLSSASAPAPDWDPMFNNPDFEKSEESNSILP